MSRGHVPSGILLFFFVFTYSYAQHTGGHKGGHNACNNGAFDYNDALNKAIIFFEGQRSGKLPANQRVKWRGDSALSDGKEENVKLAGGYYDAGDNVKFGWPMAYTVTLLSWAAIEHQKEITSAKQMEHLRVAIRWGADFIMASHTAPTTFYTRVGEGNSDHACWMRPEDMTTPRSLHKITSSSPGTEPAAEAAAALSSASIVFKNVDYKYSSKLFGHAKSLFDLADKSRGSYSASCPFYCSHSGYNDELLWAAAWMYRASAQAVYLDFVKSNQGWSQQVSEFSWDNKFAGVQTLLAKDFFKGKKDLEKFKKDADSFVCALMPNSGSVRFQTTPGGLLFVREGSNLQYVTSASMLLLIYAKTLGEAKVQGVQCNSAHFSISQIKSFAKKQVDYILGNNPMKMSYMVGFGKKYPMQLHHRGASIPSIKTHPGKVSCEEGKSKWFPSNQPNPNVHVGAIVGGPNSNDQFNDQRTSYTGTEPTTYLNAAFVGSVAGLLGLHGDQCKI